MKLLENLTNVEKARLLHELFPQEIPALLEFTNNMRIAIQEDEQLARDQWKNGLLTVEARLSFAEEVRSKIDKYRKKLHTHSRLFADQLFDGYHALYMVHCLTLYTTTHKHSNKKFVVAVDLFFNP